MVSSYGPMREPGIDQYKGGLQTYVSCENWRCDSGPY